MELSALQLLWTVAVIILISLNYNNYDCFEIFIAFLFLKHKKTASKEAVF